MKKTSKKEAKFYRDKHILGTKGHKLSDGTPEGKATAVAVAGVDPDNYDKIVGKPIKEINHDFNTLSLKQLREYEAPEYSWRVSRLIQDKKIIILGGSSAVYKSWLSLSLGLSVAKGIPFLDNFQTEQGGVLFIDRENSIPELQNRVDMLCNGLNLKDKELPIYFLSEQNFRLDEAKDRKFLEDFIIKNKISIVIVDTYRRVIGFEENSADSVSIFFTEGLKPLCERTGTSFIFIHHHKKGTQHSDKKELLRGSSDLVNFVDGIIQIDRRGNKITIKQTKNRSGKELEPFDLSVETDEEEVFKFNYLGKKEDLSIMDRGVQVLMFWFAKEKINEFETKEAQEVCKGAGIRKVNFYASLKELTKRGIIEKLSKGMYRNLDFGDSSSSTLKRVEQLNKLSPNKSNSSDSSIEQVEQLNKHKVRKEEPPKIEYLNVDGEEVVRVK